MIGAIEDAIIARIKAAATVAGLGYKIPVVKSYAGELDADAIDRLAGKMPAVFVAWRGEAKDPERVGPGWRFFPIFTVIAVAKSLRNESSTRHGSSGKAGAYQIMTDLRRLLVNQDLGLELDPLKPLRSQLLSPTRLSDRIAVYGLELVAGYQDFGLPLGELADLAAIHGDWDAAPVPGADLPLATADRLAEDQVNLPIAEPEGT